ncbi:preprotein translocase subunit SecA, partial [bacterium]|nr:preprotein translocase subunit SecA [bacterium]MBU1025480.1 preprotein translocase subunit SecA [bacterium]
LSLNALAGVGTHCVTVNDYLAKRDSEWMGQVYKLLGLTVGALQNRQDNIKRRKLYDCDILYGTNSEFGFDYLRDNMVVRAEDRVQKYLYYAIVDEVDSILIDEARTPLIISGAAHISTEFYQTANDLVRKLTQSTPISKSADDQELSLPTQKKYVEGDGDYDLDEKERTVLLTAQGIRKAEEILGIDNLYDPENTILAHHISQALRANAIFKLDKDYVVKEGQVIIVDEFTGRMMYGRRYSDGLHQAIEAKENVRVEGENQTLASITIQNYYRLYHKLSGMTGTAKTEEQEFRNIYNMDVVVVPTHKKMIRDDKADYIYKTREGKLNAVVKDIAERNKKGQPMLIGTISVEGSEQFSNRLRKKNVPHNVLNAKHHEKEAEIIKNAGQKGAVTIATNMAGRGTDIKLGEGVVELGGLHVIGTERHESRRIDNQLRGRSGRQGDPGSSRFYVSLEDDLMRIFGGDRVKNIMERLGMDENTPIEHPMISRSIENAQKKVENHHFEIRKHVLKYDDVMERQRNVIYFERNKILDGVDIRDDVMAYIDSIAQVRVEKYCNEKINRSEWEYEELLQDIQTCFPIGKVTIEDLTNFRKSSEISEFLAGRGKKFYENKEAEIGYEMVRLLERFIGLKVIDELWIRHLYGLDSLRDGIGLRAYAQTDPLVAYTKESFEMYQDMWDQIRQSVVRTVFSARPQGKPQPEKEESMYKISSMGRGNESGGMQAGGRIVRREATKTGRNDPCTCGSGKKYKKCCGA